jgi:phytoene desaturase
MNTTKKVLVVGAGVSGLATAIGLANKGFHVTVFEKNAHPGGRCGRITCQGHRFDLGATIFLMPSIYKEVFDYLELSLEKDVPSTPLSTIYKLHFADGQIVNFSTDKAFMSAQLERIEKGSSIKANQLIHNGNTLFKLAYNKLLGTYFHSWKSFITLENAALLFRIKAHIRHVSYVKRFFHDVHLQTAFSFQNIYVGQNPLTAPALFAMLPAAELSEGSLFPDGGMYAIVEALLKKAKSLGVNIVCNKPVSRIQTNKKKAIGLTFEDGSTVEGDIIVANADLPYVYKELLHDTTQTRILNKKKYSCSAIVFHWGLDKRYRQLGHHGVFISSDYEGNLNDIFKNNSMGDEPSFYVHAPVQTDPTAAPEGHDTLSIVIPVGNFTPKNANDWDFLKQKARLSVLKRLQKEGLTDIDEHIKFELCSLPENWMNSFNVARGAIFGSINHSIFQMGYFRPHNKHKRLHNLYFAGGSTHPGNGVPLVLLSAKLTTQRILEEHDI